MMQRFLPLLFIPLLFTVGCATNSTSKKPGAHLTGKTTKARITAYTQTEPGGCINAVGRHLSTGSVNSAAADWSRYPIGTKFQILTPRQVCQIDDYGSALVGTNTIDLYRPSRRAMRTWGVRVEDIKILEWGSPRRSLEILSPRTRNAHVRRMVVALKQQTKGEPKQFKKTEFIGS